uniref:Decapping nuclease n=1 Tax=Helicoverpa zea TaxID=7113 RepID=A0A3G1PYB2_HELZE|nr:putative decapping exoribonuclease protein [Helicoverpa zea]
MTHAALPRSEAFRLRLEVQARARNERQRGTIGLRFRQRSTSDDQFLMTLSRSTISNLRVGYPYIIGYMSVDVRREFHHDLSQLKYLTTIPKRRIQYNLNHNIEKAVKRTTDGSNEKISLMLRFLLNQRYRLDFLNNPTGTTFITYRRTLISVMTSIYSREPVSIIASLLNNCIYLCSVESTESLKNSNTSCDQNAKFCAWGYKFEQYMLSDLPVKVPNIEKPVIENEEFSIYFSSQLGKHRLFYGAQIDGMLAKQNASGPPKTSDVDANLTYLRNADFVELKTNREIHNPRQEKNFKKYKMLRCWCQCYLAGLKGLLVGYRNDEGIIHRVQWFDTEDIVRYCRNMRNGSTLGVRALSRASRSVRRLSVERALESSSGGQKKVIQSISGNDRFRFVNHNMRLPMCLTINLVQHWYSAASGLNGSDVDEWKPQVAIDNLVHFLSYVENCFKSLKTTSKDDFASKEPLTLKFDIDAQQKITGHRRRLIMVRSHARVQIDIQRAQSRSPACKRYARARERARARECRESGECRFFGKVQRMNVRAPGDCLHAGSLSPALSRRFNVLRKSLRSEITTWRNGQRCSSFCFFFQ